MLQCWVAQPSAHAQAFDIDLDPPLIEHAPLSESEAGIGQSFLAQVVDDRELASVSLFWRYAGEARYASLAMNRISSSSTWIARIPTSPADSRSIEYYLEARDTAGNRTLRGFVFNPLVRRIVGAAEPGESAIETPYGGTSATDPGDTIPAVSRRRVVYYVLGALFVGVLVGFASSGGGGGSRRECGSDGCEIDIDFESPVVQ